MKKEIFGSIKFLFIMVVICGGIYTLLVTGIGQLFFSNKANGSLIDRGDVVGSVLVGQEFIEDRYFQGRPVEVSQLSPKDETLKETINTRIKEVQEKNNSNKKVPTDLVTASGSGLDPHISLEGANYQVKRISEVRNKKTSEINDIIENKTKTDFITGNKYVNVLELNLALDDLK